MNAQQPGDMIPLLPTPQLDRPCTELAPVVYGWTRGRDPAVDRAWWQTHSPCDSSGLAMFFLGSNSTH